MGSGAEFRGRDVGEDGVDGEMLWLRGDAAAARNSGELRRDGSLLHKNSKEKCSELRRDTRKGVARSRVWGIDGIDRKRGNLAAAMGGSGERLGRPGGVVLVGE